MRAAIGLFESGGWVAIRPALRGRAKGDGRVLSQVQEDTIQRMIIDKRAYEQSPAAMQAWLEGEYPGIERRARAEGAEIHWGDETALVNTDVRGRGFAPAEAH